MRVFAGFAADSPVTRTEASSTLLSLIGIRSHFEGAWSPKAEKSDANAIRDEIGRTATSQQAVKMSAAGKSIGAIPVTKCTDVESPPF